MKPLPESSMDQHTMFIHALCQDWLEAGTVTRITPRADRILEISRSLCKGGSEVLGLDLGASASPSGSRPSDQANLRCPDALRIDPSRGDA